MPVTSLYLFFYPLSTLFTDPEPQKSDRNLSHTSYPLNNLLRFLPLEKPLGGQKELGKTNGGGGSKNFKKLYKAVNSVFTKRHMESHEIFLSSYFH